MDFTWIFTSLMLAAYNHIMTALGWLLSLPLYKMYIHEESLAKALGTHIAKCGVSYRKQYNGLSIVPSDGLHYIRLDGQRLIAYQYKSYKSQVPHFDVYSFTSLDGLHKKLLPGRGCYQIKFEVTSTEYQKSEACMEQVRMPVGVAYQWQKDAIAHVMTEYKQSGKMCHSSLLVWGDSGVGKTTIAKYMSEYMLQQGMDPVIVYGFSPTMVGINFITMNRVTNRTEKSPIIIVLNEWDEMVKEALTVDKKVSKVCYAQDKSSLCDFRDWLDDLQYCIIIATMNPVPPTTIEHKPFYRRQSFNVQMQANIVEGEQKL